MRNSLASSTSHLFIQVREVKTEVWVKFVVSFLSFTVVYQVSVGVKKLLVPSLFSYKLSLKMCSIFTKNRFNLLFLIAQSVLNVQNFHSFPTRLRLKAKNSKQAS